MMDSEKRIFIALLLSIAVIFLYQWYVVKTYRSDKPGAVPAGQQVPLVKQELLNETGIHPARSFAGAQDDPSLVDQNTPRGQIINSLPSAAEDLVTIENDLYRVVLTNRGAAIKEISLREFKDRHGEPTLLAKIADNSALIFATENTMMPEEPALWKLVNRGVDRVVYEKEDKYNKIRKEYFFHNTKYSIELKIEIENRMDVSQQVRYKIVGGSGLSSDNNTDARYLTGAARVAEKIIRRNPANKNIRGGEVFNGALDWASTGGRYFVFILKPEEKTEAGFFESRDGKTMDAGAILGPLTIGPKEVVQRNYTLYAGPFSQEKMAFLGGAAQGAISYGAFNGIAALIIKALKFFYSVTNNYGIAIILISLSISLLLFPLTKKSLRSIKEMQKVQPEIEQIRNAYKDNPQKQNKEIMELYKKHKINPMGGCLPMFLQFPIFISLYNVLMKSVELKGARFLWIRDLAEPDAIFTFPYTIPMLGSRLNILPVLLIVASVIQQRVSQPKSTVAPEQRMMLFLFPIMLGVIFYNMPSGVVLYWFTNTLILMALQEFALKAKTARYG